VVSFIYPVFTRQDININIWQYSISFRHNRLFILLLHQACTNPWRKVDWATEFTMVAPNIVGPPYGTFFTSPFWPLEFCGGS